MKKFSDFAKEQIMLEGSKVRIDEVVNREIYVTGCLIKSSRYKKNESGKYLTLQFNYTGDEELHVLFTGSDVIINQLERYADEIPFVATIKKINRYYTLS